MKFSKLIAGFFAATLLLNVACKDDEIFEDRGTFDKGYLISNEGSFGHNNAEVSFISEGLDQIQNDIFKINNANEPLGDVLQSIAFSNVNAYLVVNNYNKIQVVNRYGLKKITTITDNINQPRYVTTASNYIYVTNSKYGGEHYVSIYKSADNSFVKRINFSDDAERIVAAGNKVFVQNASYGFGHNISVINTGTNELEKTISLPNGDINKTIAFNNDVYTIAYNGVDSFIYKISGQTGEIVTETKLSGIPSATNLDIEGNTMYFSSANKVYSLDLGLTIAPKLLFEASKSDYGTLYGFNVIDGKIFTSNAGDFASASEITVYSTIGSKLKSFTAGVAVNGFYKN